MHILAYFCTIEHQMIASLLVTKGLQPGCSFPTRCWSVPLPLQEAGLRALQEFLGTNPLSIVFNFEESIIALNTWRSDWGRGSNVWLSFESLSRHLQARRFTSKNKKMGFYPNHLIFPSPKWGSVRTILCTVTKSCKGRRTIPRLEQASPRWWNRHRAWFCPSAWAGSYHPTPTVSKVL